MANRPIKFRAWNKKEKEMWEVFEIDFHGEKIKGGKGFTKGKGTFYNILIANFRDVIPLQFTGLKDKKGVEIYEGDILLWQNPEEEKGVGDIHEVVFKEGAFQKRWINTYGKTSFTLLADINEFEIIGNIYEDKKLLKQK